MQQFGAVVNRQIENHAAMATRELSEQRREKIVAGADHRYVQLAARDPPQLLHRLLAIAELLDDRPAEAEHFETGWRQISLASELLEQRQTRVRFKLLDLRRYGRLR